MARGTKPKPPEDIRSRGGERRLGSPAPWSPLPRPTLPALGLVGERAKLAEEAGTAAQVLPGDSQ